MKVKKFRYFSADFETTVFQEQKRTDVWAAASVELFTEEVKIHHSIGEQLRYFLSLKCNVMAYFHNLKFDGSFWLHHLIVDLKLTQACETLDSESEFPSIRWMSEKEMPNNSFKYSITDRGQWYNIVIKMRGRFIELRDSVKLLPFSLKRIGESFGTKHKKLTMEYTGYRFPGCMITPEEREYIQNDVLVLKEALEIMFQDGHSSLTIGSCCMKEFQKTCFDTDEYQSCYPNLYEIPLYRETYGADNIGEYIRRSYRGGWCYVVSGKECRVIENGQTYDANSLYPSHMHSRSGNRYPVGKPTIWSGNYIPDEALKAGRYYFIRIRTRFYIKEGMLPFIQIKNNLLYPGTEMLETSDIYDAYEGKYCSNYTGMDGEVKDTRVTLTLTMSDYELFLTHYDTKDFEILDGAWFLTDIGMFDEYINKYMYTKMHSVGAVREMAKLFLNNLYGKLATSTESSFKVAYVKEDGTIGFYPVKEHRKKPGYIPCGSAIISYARCETIRVAQMNYHGADKPGFAYADTDSIHGDFENGEIKGIVIHDSELCCWKHETNWDKGFFTRQKTYIEHVTETDGKPDKKPYYNIKCAGMTERCKKLYDMSLNGIPAEKDFSKAEKDFLKKQRRIEDFQVGLRIPGKLRPKRVPGGIILVDTTYVMH